MSEKGVTATLALSSLVLAACGAKTLDFTATGDGAAPGPFVTTTFRKDLPNKVDLLFMIDNSSSMLDKHAILATAVPDLVDRLIDPRCVDPLTGRTVGNAINGVCTVGELAFEPVKDIHIGIISSSLGNHGAGGVCEDVIEAAQGRSDPHNDDRAHLIARGTGGVPVPTFQNNRFLYYNPSGPGGLATTEQVVAPFQEMVIGVGQHGCGYEASLEAVYRFLVDPEPYDTIRIDTSIGGFGTALLNGTDQQVLRQRRDFLRPDSVVSVVLVTDENDCSIIDGGQGFYAVLPPLPGTGRSFLKPGTSICKTNPNDACCLNCGATQIPAGCPPLASDPACQTGELLVVDDQPNLRCFNQKQRYGFDFLYPVSRYIDGFSKAKVPRRNGQMVDNPLFADLTCAPDQNGQGCLLPGRDPSLVYLTGIVGVPWQDLAVDPTDLQKGYKTPAQMRDSGTWATIVGDPRDTAGPVPPSDPHMVESIKPRDGLPGPESGPNADPIHGHEWDPSLDNTQPNADLQYACVFDLTPTRICSDPVDCDCFGADMTMLHNPLCQNAAGAYTNEQVRAKAYPGTRILQVLQGLGDQGVAASICPAQTTEPTGEDYGYTPALGATLNQLRKSLRDQCMPQALAMDANGQTGCAIIEAFNDKCDCNNEPGRRTAPGALITPEMRNYGSCLCEIAQLSGEGLGACKASLNPPANAGNGWCYVDPAQDSGASCDVVRSCPIENKRVIKFINVNSEPRPGATAFLRCDAQPLPPTRYELPLKNIVLPLTTTPPMACK